MARGKDELLNPEREAAKARFLGGHGLGAPPVLETPICPPGASDAERLALGYNAAARLAAGSVAAFVAAAAYLRDHGLAAPKGGVHDVELGLAVLEALGDGLFAALIAAGAPATPLYEAAVDAQVVMQAASPP